jgi:ribonuclease BN (tRNA processing enzyme)|tara:strand:- start:502 stop:1398 length:897 start_codon:yes stop_codon:yes gene_type:complete
MIRFMICIVALLSASPSALGESCRGNPVAVQILGSGGPFINEERASTSYLVWVDAEAKVLLDAGGGAFLRFGQSRAKLSDLSLVAISHLHPDHVSDLPALLWLSNLQRQEPLPMSGPSGNDVVPDFPEFLNRLFDGKKGAFQVLGGTLVPGAGGGVKVDPSVVDTKKTQPSPVYAGQGLTVTAMGIPHGDIPTLAYRIETRDTSIVFSFDQAGTNPRFIDFARGADLLVMHLAIGAGRAMPLHASPAVVGKVAQETEVQRLIVSHIGRYDLAAAMGELREFYNGRAIIGNDLQCTQVL